MSLGPHFGDIFRRNGDTVLFLRPSGDAGFPAVVSGRPLWCGLRIGGDRWGEHVGEVRDDWLWVNDWEYLGSVDPSSPYSAHSFPGLRGILATADA